MPREYRHIQEYIQEDEKEIMELRYQGKTGREIREKIVYRRQISPVFSVLSSDMDTTLNAYILFQRRFRNPPDTPAAVPFQIASPRECLYPIFLFPGGKPSSPILIRCLTGDFLEHTAEIGHTVEVACQHGFRGGIPVVQHGFCTVNPQAALKSF